jgi:hypothetical protein
MASAKHKWISDELYDRIMEAVDEIDLARSKLEDALWELADIEDKEGETRESNDLYYTIRNDILDSLEEHSEWLYNYLEGEEE